MGVRFGAARAVCGAATWGLRNVFHRSASNFPGKLALYVDPQAIAHAVGKLTQGSIIVVGTNGKTTVTNLVADVMERAGHSVVCNREGANLSSGVACALLNAHPAEWGVFESDELWLARTLPQLKATYVLLLNLFRDQLDRCGEIDRIQDSIVSALESSPDTVLVYNADDPLCASIALRARNRSFGFGLEEDMRLPQNTVSDAQMCQQCSTMLEYDYRQYGQLGVYRCPSCGFARPRPAFAATEVRLGVDGLGFRLRGPGAEGDVDRLVTAPFSGSYMVYNLTALGALTSLLGCPGEALQDAIDAFDPRNGRLQTYDLNGRRVLLNLAKNPTGFNQNLKIVAQDKARKAVAFFINDKEADGHDVSWLWDIDFEELRQSGELVVYASGIRGHDMQVRLKYAGVPAEVLPDAEAVLDRMDALPPDVDGYLIANYTALPAAKAALDKRARPWAGSKDDGSQRGGSPTRLSGRGEGALAEDAGGNAVPAVGSTAEAGEAVADGGANGEVVLSGASASGTPIVVAHIFPDLLNLYGDGGNVRVLEQRLRWRGVPVEVRRIKHGQPIDFSTVDLVFLGGGPDREQRLAAVDVMKMRGDLARFVDFGGVLLAICGGYQLLGREWLLDGDCVEGLGLVGMTTRRPGTSADRLIDNIVLRVPGIDQPVVGYENHSGRTYLDPGVEPFGEVVSSVGHGNNDADKRDGVRYKNLVGTYLHGPLLAKNPQFADDLLARAIEYHAQRTGEAPFKLAPLDDAEEIAANQTMCQRLGVR